MTSTPHTHSTRSSFRTAARLLALTMVSMLTAPLARAQSLRDVTYVAGTALPADNMHGKLSILPIDALVFEGPSRLVVPYDHVLGYESKSMKQVQVGLLTEGIWRLLAPWPEAKRLSLTYKDADEHTQVVLLQMSRGDEALLVEVLKTRVSHAGAPPASLTRRPVFGQDQMAAR